MVFVRAVAISLAALLLLTAVVLGDENLYSILGVSRQATTQEIKRAYRKKALDTHPDKNPDLPADEAAEVFHKVVEAFEVLSDPSSRNQYDRTGRKPDSAQQQQQHQYRQQQQYQQQQWHFYRQWQRPRLKDKPQVKQAQARLMHIVSLAQFQTVLMDDTGDRLERHVLLAAVNPQLETHVMDEMVFPYPFAGMSSQGIWWEDLLQTVLIRYHNQNELTQALGLPRGQDLGDAPVFLLGKQGQSLDDEPWSRVVTRNRHELEAWVWREIQVELEFVNHHDSAVEIYWIDGNRASIKVPRLEPGATVKHWTHLTHEWYIRDVRVDSRSDSPGRWKLSPNSTLIQFQVLNATYHQQFHIPKRTCVDLSGHCRWWQQQGECTKNPVFMREQCPLTCQHCSDAQDQINMEKAKRGTYEPWAESSPESAALHEEL